MLRNKPRSPSWWNSIPVYSPSAKASMAKRKGLTVLSARTMAGGGLFKSTPLGLMIPTTIKTTNMGTLAVTASEPEGGDQLEMKNPREALATVMSENVAVTLPQEIQRPEQSLSTVVKTAAKNESSGSSAHILAARYSNGEYCCRVCSRWMTGLSSEKIVTAFMNAMNAMLIAPNDKRATLSATDPARGGDPGTTEGNIFDSKRAFPALARNRNKCKALLRMFCLQDRRKSAANRVVINLA
mmetsp:Transcript_23637/g.54250  ORF Transcript_23637/g.54250 Transcript_23637/m.54250 type:complete len:241 (-) Transcript_23637:473-1195(-)